MNEKLRAARLRAGWTMARTAQEAGLKVWQNYQQYEYDLRRPGVDIAIRLARALGSTVEEIFGESSTTA